MQPLVKWLQGALSLWVKQPGREDHYVLLMSKLRMNGAVSPLPLMPSLQPILLYFSGEKNDSQVSAAICT